MFLGESLCLVPFALRRWWRAAKRAGQQSEEEAGARSRQLRRSFWVFSLPAMCDAAASTLLNLGLFYTCGTRGARGGGAGGLRAGFMQALWVVMVHAGRHDSRSRPLNLCKTCSKPSLPAHARVPWRHCMHATRPPPLVAHRLFHFLCAAMPASFRCSEGR